MELPQSPPPQDGHTLLSEQVAELWVTSAHVMARPFSARDPARAIATTRPATRAIATTRQWRDPVMAATPPGTERAGRSRGEVEGEQRAEMDFRNSL